MKNSNQQSIPIQVTPVWDGPRAMHKARYEVWFEVELPALGLAPYYVSFPANGQASDDSVSTVRMTKAYLASAAFVHLFGGLAG